MASVAWKGVGWGAIGTYWKEEVFVFIEKLVGLDRRDIET